MERTRPALVVAVIVASFSSGCISVQVDWPGKEKKPAADVIVDGTIAKGEKPKAESGVKQAAAFLPAGPIVSPSIPKIFSRADSSKQASHIMSIWRDKVEYLPDPSRNGAMGAGLVGQLFLYGPDMKFVNAEGSFTVEMYDESAKPGTREPVYLGKWTFEKDVIRQLVTVDERWGKSYAIFLPWPDYKADITRVKLTARYDQEGGFTLFAPATSVTFNTHVPGLPGSASPTSMSPIGGPPPESGFPTPGVAPAPFPAVGAPAMPANIPVGAPAAPQYPGNAAAYPALPMQPMGPGGLPPIATIAPGR